MSEAQWLLMYGAIRKADDEYFERFKNVLISILGLRIMNPKHEDGKLKRAEEITREDLEKFTPLIFYTARPEALKQIYDEFEQSKAIKEASTDSEFERLSKAMAENPDMEPIGVSSLPIAQLNQLSAQWKHIEDLMVVKTEPPKFDGDPGRPRKKMKFMDPNKK
jgi:hypothetical protein